MRAAEAGFTLIEVLVALVVSSLLLAVLYQGSSLALSRLRATDDRRAALLYGRYLLLRGSALDYGGGNGSGRDGVLAWTSEETLVTTDQRKFDGLMRIHVVVKNAAGQTLFDRATLRLKALPQR